MIKISKISVMNFENAIRGMRNALNSWEKSDSHYNVHGDYIQDELRRLEDEQRKAVL